MRIAVTDSKTRTKQNDIKTLCISVVIPGLAQHCLVMQQLFTILQTDLTRQIHVDIVEKTFLAPAFRRLLS